MARTTTITDNLSLLQITNTDTDPTPLTATLNLAKDSISDIYITTPDIVCIDQYNLHHINIDWTRVTSPVVVSALDLYAQLIAMWQNMPSAGIFTQVDTFTNASLVDGIATFVYTISHPFNTPNCFVVIQDPLGTIIGGLSPVVNPVAPYDVTIDFGGAIGAGNWTSTLIAFV